MNQISLYPLKFEPIYQYRLWGGRRLSALLATPLPVDIPIGEAWILSDRDDHASMVSDGPLKGRTLRELIELSPEEMMGKSASRRARFPLLLKFLDVTKNLSVQVHPPDGRADLIPPGETGKTEAWVVLEEGCEGRVYAGLKPGATEGTVRDAITKGTLANDLSSFEPKRGDAVLVKAGTVHSLRDVVVFEVQENSDVTFRLFDWNHVDAETGKERPLQVEQALACIDFAQGVLDPLPPDVDEMTPVLREKLFHCSHFTVSRIQGDSPFIFGAADSARILVCTEGEGRLNHGGERYPFRRGDVVLLPAIIGACSCEPEGAVTVLDVTIPELDE